MDGRSGATTRWGVMVGLGLLVAGLVAAAPAMAGTVRGEGLRAAGASGVAQDPSYAPADLRAVRHGSGPARNWTPERGWRDRDHDRGWGRGRHDGWRHDRWRDSRWRHGPFWRPGWHSPHYRGWGGPRPIHRPGQWFWNGWGWVWVPW